MDLNEFLILLQAFIFGWVGCRFYMAWKLKNTLKRIAEDNGLTLEELGENLFEMQGVRATVMKVPNYFTEHNGSSMMLYKDSGDFAGQASTIDELAENLYNYNKIKFATVKHNEEILWFVEGKVKSDIKDI